MARLIILLFSILYYQNVNALDTTDNLKAFWGGIEVFGVNKQEAQKIRALIPIRIGEPFILSERKEYRSMCNIIKKNTNFEDVNCDLVIFGDNKAYFLVEISPPGTKKNIFRKIPKKETPIAIMPKELNLLFDKWDKRMYFLFSNGKSVGEKYSNGFLDFEDPTLHELVVKISKYAYQNNDKLLDIVRFSPNDEERYKAATLLTWSNHTEENLQFILEWDLLNDPDQGVRNILARSFSFLMSEVKNESLLKNFIPIYCKQATLPSHTDRNKALSSLLSILEANPRHGTEISSECRETIIYISEQSILENVGGTAKDILVILKDTANDKSTHIDKS